MASAELSRRVENVVGYPPLFEMAADQRREFQETLLERRSDVAVPATRVWRWLGSGSWSLFAQL